MEVVLKDYSDLSLDELRVELERQNRRASRKIAKIKRGEYIRKGDILEFLRGHYGVDITGTEHDPRISKGRAKRYNRRQLVTAIQRIDEFASSQNISFFSDANGRPISSAAIRSAVTSVRSYNKQISEYRESIQDILVPWLGEGLTAGEYHMHMSPRREYLGDQSFYQIQERRLPVPTRFTSDKNAHLWADHLRSEMLPSAQAARVNSARSQINEMIDMIGSSDLRRKVERLSDDQLWFLWTNDSSFADAFSLIYEHAKNKDNPDKSDFYKSVMEDASIQQSSRLESILDYGAQINFS